MVFPQRRAAGIGIVAAIAQSVFAIPESFPELRGVSGEIEIYVKVHDMKSICNYLKQSNVSHRFVIKPVHTIATVTLFDNCITCCNLFIHSIHFVNHADQRCSSNDNSSDDPLIIGRNHFRGYRSSR